MKQQTQVYLVNHTHWDREWYFSEQDSLVLSDILFSNAIQELKRNPSAKFVLDGQISIVEDYLKIHPEKKKDIIALNKKGQLKIGPWFTQTDALHVQAESILHNGIIGGLLSKNLGSRMEVGYLPDTFGFNAQLPVILRHLGFNNFIFWRGIDLAKTESPYFYWYDLKKNHKVLAINMPQGYSTGMLLQPNHNYVDGRLDPAVEFIKKHSPEDITSVLIPTGNDQMNIISDFKKKVSQINEIGKYSYQISDYETFCKAVAQKKLPKYTGEFIDPVLARIHRTCGSNRIDTKIASTNLERKIINQLEPLLVIGRKYGINISTGSLIETWKKLLRSQAHDSMAGSVVDSVNQDILHRLCEGEELADGMINTIEKMLSLKLGLNQTNILLLNPYIFATNEYHKVKVLSKTENIEFNNAVSDSILISSKKIPARDHALKETPSGDEYGIEPAYYVNTYFIKTSIEPLDLKVISFKSIPNDNKKLDEDKENQIIAKDYSIKFINNKLVFKNKNTEIKDFIYLSDQANDGDTYDYSPLPNNKSIKLHFSNARVLKNHNVQIMKLSGVGKVPNNLESWKKDFYDGEINFSMDLVLINDRLEIKMHVNNTTSDHCLSLVVNTGISNGRTIASVPFGYIERKDEKLENWEDSYAEKPVSVWPLDNNVSIFSKRNTFTVFSKNVKQYSSIKGNLIFPLLNATGQLGKSDLINRPGRASGDTDKVGHPKIATPLAEVHKPLEYEFAVNIADKFLKGKIQTIEEKLKFKTAYYQMQKLNLFVNRLDNKLQDDLVKKEKVTDQRSSFGFIPSNIGISACYPAYFSSSSFILRIFNPTDKTISIKIPSSIKCVDALEREKNYEGVLKSYDVLSLKVPYN